MSYAVDGFFRNGGKRCYVARVVKAFDVQGDVKINERPEFAKTTIEVGSGKITLYAAGPGNWGNGLYYKIEESEVNPDTTEYFNLKIYYFKKVPEEDKLADPDKNATIIESVEDVSVDPISNKYYKNELNSLSNLIWADDDLLDFTREQIQKPASGEAVKFEYQILEEEKLNSIDYTGQPIIEEKEGVELKYFSGNQGLERIEDISIVCAPNSVDDSINTRTNYKQLLSG